MKKILFFILFTYSFISLGQSKIINEVKLSFSEFSSSYKQSKKIKCQSIQSTLLYKNPELYSYILGNNTHKEFQTFKYKGKKGSILYFEFDQETENGVVFLENLLWGGNKPNKSHPEIIFTKDNVLIILSFPFKSRISNELNEVFLNIVKD